MTLPKPQKAQPVNIDAIFAERRAQLAIWEQRATEAQAKGAQAYARLLSIAEGSDTGQASRVAAFIASTFNGYAFPFDLFELRGLDVEISDDMMACIDALRWGKADLHKLVPEGQKRVQALIQAWGLKSIRSQD